MLQGHGDLQGQLSKVIQGSDEPYVEFVDRLLQTAGRVFGDSEQAIKQHMNKLVNGAGKQLGHGKIRISIPI